jgi:CubicO group peptidase (beta-lactamase class C family)
MMNYLRVCGPAGWGLLLISLVVIIVIVHTVNLLVRQGNGQRPTLLYSLNALVFWGFMGAVLGFLGQTSAIHEAMTVIIPAKSISPEMIDRGFRESFLPSFWGFGIFVSAIMASFVFRLILRRGSDVTGGGPTTSKLGTRTACFLVVACGLWGPTLVLAEPGSAIPDVLISKVWTGKGGPDDIVFKLWVTDDGLLSGEAHTLRGGKHRTQSPATQVIWEDPEIVLHMNTGVILQGKLDEAAARIDGELIYQGKQLMQLPLDGVEAGSVKGLLARSVQPGKPIYSYALPTEISDGWRSAGPETFGLEPAQLEGLVTDVIQGKAGILHSLLIASNGKLILEEYFHGYESEDLHRLASVTKSVSSLITGIAIDQGLIKGVGAAVIDFFPHVRKHASKGWNSVTLEHLLTMSIGTAWTEEEASRTHGAGDEFFRKLLSRDFADTPGERWQYVSANVNLLGGVIKSATGMHADEFAEAHLFGPLEIEKWNWNYGMVDGFRLMDGSLMLRPRDMAKLGALVAGRGSWNEKQIVSKEWIEESTAPHFIPSEEGPEKYGYLWWLFYIPSTNGTQEAVVANGAGSQLIAVFPALNLVVVTTGANDENGMQFAIGKLLSMHVLSNMKVTKPN